MHYPIQPMPPDLWPAVREIYGQGIATGNATFETDFQSGKSGTAAITMIATVALEP